MLPVDQDVETDFGRGKVVQYREPDSMYEIALLNGKAILYTMKVSGIANDESQDKRRGEEQPWTTGSSVTSYMSTCSDLSGSPNGQGGKKETAAMELNEAYQAYEKMRKLNLELECSEAGITIDEHHDPINFDTCTRCLIINGPTRSSSLNNTKPPMTNKSGKHSFPLWHKFRMETQQLMNASHKKIMESTTTKKKSPPCLLCGSPTCPKHASTTFRKNHITVCQECVATLEFDFDGDTVDPMLLQKRVTHLVDLYDRALLLLQYSMHHLLEPVALSLEQATQRDNQVNVGSSSVGLVSGALGVAAACTILTPAGPPLLIASLVCGGSATAVQTGTQVSKKFFSEPHQVAHRILALKGLLESMMRTTKRMRELTLLPYLDRAVSELLLNKDTSMLPQSGEREEGMDKVQTAVATGAILAGSTAATSMAQMVGVGLVEEGALVSSRFMTRASSNLARSARFAQFAGGALSAATLVLEARELKHTVEQIRKGNPCETAERLRKIANEDFPKTSTVDSICESYFKVRSKQLHAKRLIEGLNGNDSILPEDREEDCDLVVEGGIDNDDDLVLVEEVVTSLEATHEDPSMKNGAQQIKRNHDRYAPSSAVRLDLSKLSLLERVQRFKEREAEVKATIDLVV